MPKAQVKVFPSTVHITIHEPISTAGYSKENVVQLMDRTREKVFSALGQDEAELSGAATLNRNEAKAGE
jgi:hypothetical protein